MIALITPHYKDWFSCLLSPLDNELLLVSKFPCIPEFRQEFKTKQEFSEQIKVWVNTQGGPNPTPGHVLQQGQ